MDAQSLRKAAAAKLAKVAPVAPYSPPPPVVLEASRERFVAVLPDGTRTLFSDYQFVTSDLRLAGKLLQAYPQLIWLKKND